MPSSSLFPKKSFLNIRGQLYALGSPKIMGILNITEDSFFDGGNNIQIDSQLQQVEKMLNNGADIIDIGAQSTRPGATEIGEQMELNKILPSITAIRKRFPEAIISIDTWYSKVAKAAFDAGAYIINDISGGQFDEKMFETISQIQIPYILSHTLGRPGVMQDNPQYNNVLKDVILFLSKQINQLNLLGVNDIIIDPGFGFGKTLEDNFELLNQLNHFAFLEAPILVGLSRKSMIYKSLNNDPKDALNGTTALHMIALKQGAHILRVHDVKEAKECIQLFKSL